METLVVLENHFFLDSNNNVWCDRVVDYNYLQRYLNVFDSIILMGRTKIVDNIDGEKMLVSGNNVEFVALPDFKGAKGLLLNLFKIKSMVRTQTKRCNCVIYRAPTHLSLFTYKEVIKQNKILGLEFMMAADKMFDGNGIVINVLNKLVDAKAKKMCLKANGVSYVTESILQKKYPCRALFVNGENDYFTESYSSIDLNDNQFFEQNWNKNVKPETFKVIHTGYMDSYRKGHDILIKAIKKVVDRGYNNIELVLIGDGKKRPEFEQLARDLNISEYVVFKGLLIDKNDILNELRNSHIFAFPTRSEGLPRSIIEAMSQGLVCIASPVDGIPELLDKEFLIDTDGVDLYANKIIDLLNDWEKCCNTSEENYKRSLKYEKSNLDTKRSEFYKKLKRLSDIV